MVTSSLLFPVQNLFPRRAKGRARGSTDLVGGAGGGVSAGFSSHSHAKFVSQLMRESRFRVSKRGEREEEREGEGRTGGLLPGVCSWFLTIVMGIHVS